MAALNREQFIKSQQPTLSWEIDLIYDTWEAAINFYKEAQAASTNIAITPLPQKLCNNCSRFPLKKRLTTCTRCIHNWDFEDYYEAVTAQ